ncbi:hypothetical protein LZD76_04155 [Lactobacillus mulieris]|uniref:hypothetical protein n=1 Tax=Lactobacillus mulieris TaxID=2508708 RepID=UPI001F39DEAF|nr:hypothetical protein [Lactobacillus mulieris]MCF1783641.1 hypothetical protein [Lactobacillus mulieris]MCW8104271.1 hypothetical protein [Lactobacillus mulieris]
MKIILGLVFLVLLCLLIIAIGLMCILIYDCFKGGKLTELSHKDLPWVTLVYGVITLVLWYGVKVTNPFATPDTNRKVTATKTNHKSKYETEIYPTEITKMEVEKSGSDHFAIYLDGTTNAPDEAYIMAQENDDSNTSEKCNVAEDGYEEDNQTAYEGYARIKNGKFRIFLDDSFDQENIKAGQSYKIKIFAVTDKRLKYVDDMSYSFKYNMETDYIPKFVEKALKNKDIPSYSVVANEKMEYYAYHSHDVKEE